MSPPPSDLVTTHHPGPKPAGASALEGTALSATIVDAAHQLGFARAGVASIGHFEPQKRRLQLFLDQGYAGDMGYLALPQSNGVLQRGEIAAVFPETRSIISVALPYQALVPLRLGTSSPSESLAYVSMPYVAAYARGDDYHHVVRALLETLADRVAQLCGFPVRARACVDSAPLFERDIAVQAGFAFLGKNTLAIAPGLGSRFVLGELLVDAELQPTQETTKEGCGSCSACLDVCPTGAFLGPHRMDATKCISYLTIESKGPIPKELRAQIGNHVFGCDLCQAVCPYNHGRHPAPHHPSLESERFLDLNPVELLHITSGNFKRLVRGTALRRISRAQFCRNIAVVLGNLGLAHSVDSLRRAVRAHPYPVVQQHAAWALTRLAQHFGRVEAQAAIHELSVDDPILADLFIREADEPRRA